MHRRRFLQLPLAMAAPVMAGQFWETTGGDTWTGAQRKQVAMRSPWTRPVNIRLPGGISSATAPGPAGGRAGEPAASGGDDGSISGALSSVLVRWDSALPVVEACSHSNTDKDLFSCASTLFTLSVMGKKFDDMRLDFYILSLSNYPITQRGKEAIQYSEASTAALEKMTERMRTTSWLQPKGRKPFPPDHIIALPWNQALLLLFFFSRSNELSLDDREVAFQSVNGSVEVRTTFNLLRMKYQGKLAL